VAESVAVACAAARGLPPPPVRPIAAKGKPEGVRCARYDWRRAAFVDAGWPAPPRPPPAPLPAASEDGEGPLGDGGAPGSRAPVGPGAGQAAGGAWVGAAEPVESCGPSRFAAGGGAACSGWARCRLDWALPLSPPPILDLFTCPPACLPPIHSPASQQAPPPEQAPTESPTNPRPPLPSSRAV
jgi:hypothetical protein